ncbi:MAG: hypothetical protein WD003_01590 [Candidatus Paceibacterota bacterium]
MNVLLHRNARYQKARFFKKAIIDEGFFQNILSIYEDVIDRKTLKKMLRSIPKPELLVVFNINEKMLYKREKEKTRTSHRNFNLHYYKEWRETIEKNHLLFLSLLNELNIRYVIISNSSEAGIFYEKYA